MSEQQTFEPFARESAYVRVNERLIGRLVRRLRGCRRVRFLDIAAGTGLMTSIAMRQAPAGLEIRPTLVDLDIPALSQTRAEMDVPGAEFVIASASALPFASASFDAAVVGNALHLLDDDEKSTALTEARRVLRPGGLFALNTTFYGGAYPEVSRPFYPRWTRRALALLRQQIPNRAKSERVQAMEWLDTVGYRKLVECHGFQVVELRERSVGLSQAAVRAISSYKEFAKGALHATDEDAEEASRALQVAVQPTFRDLGMKYLRRNWLEIIAARP
jgi:ubiquinone/menaquinone biosynthesis C-methylase UbiE